MKLLAVSLSKTDYGFYALIASIIAFVLMMPFTALLQGVSRYVSIYQRRGQYQVFLSSIFFLVLSLVGLYVVLSILIGLFYPLGTEWRNKYIYIVIFAVSEILKVMFKTINNANRERKNIAISVFVEFFIKIGLIFTIHKFYSLDILDVLVALTVGNIIAVFIMYIKSIQYISLSNITRKYFKVHVQRIWLFGYPLLIWAIFGWLRDMSNRWYLDYFLNKEQVALFAMMSSLALVVPVALQGVIGSFFIPIIYQKENTEKGYARRFLIILLPILAIFFLMSFVVVYFFKDLIVILLTDEKYLSVSWMLPWMFLTYSLYVLSMISTYELFAHNQTKKLIVSTIAPGIISLVCGYFLIKEYETNGALINYMITYGSYSLFTLIVVWNYWRNNDNN